MAGTRTRLDDEALEKAAFVWMQVEGVEAFAQSGRWVV